MNLEEELREPADLILERVNGLKSQNRIVSMVLPDCEDRDKLAYELEELIGAYLHIEGLVDSNPEAFSSGHLRETVMEVRKRINPVLYRLRQAYKKSRAEAISVLNNLAEQSDEEGNRIYPLIAKNITAEK